jgi:hypothetical protein
VVALTGDRYFEISGDGEEIRRDSEQAEKAIRCGVSSHYPQTAQAMTKG